MILKSITIYTDGSCHTQLKIGAWAAMVLVDDTKKILTGTATNTTHQIMELMAAINALENVQEAYPSANQIEIISDSQYVVDLPARLEKLSAANYQSKQSKPIQNAALVQMFHQLIKDKPITFTKVKAHLKKTGSNDYNIEVDKLCRKLVRERVNGIIAS